MGRMETAFKYANEQRDYLESRVKEGIEKNRKGDMKIKLTDKKGNPIVGAKVSVKLKNHEFRHGSNIFMLDELETDEKNQLYKEQVGKAVNMATLPFYWKDQEPRQNETRYTTDSEKIYRRPAPDLCLEYCKKYNIEPKLHCLNYSQWTPDWVPDNVETTKKLLEKRYGEISERYANKINDIEVVNEMLLACKRKIFNEPDIIKWSFELAEKYFPNNNLMINEAGDVYEHMLFGTRMPYYGKRMPYYMLIKNLLNDSVRIDKIGLQYHFFFPKENEAESAEFYFNPKNIYKILDDLSEFGKPIQITEITIPAYSESSEDEETQAQLLRMMYSIWFSHPAVTGAIYWNMVDGYAAYAPQGDMTSGENYYYGGLLRFDLSQKPSYKVFYDLFHKEWNTEEDLITDENGECEFRGFYGDYEITVEGKKHNLSFYKKNDNKAEINQ